ncbi:NEW3 domain-containing protein [Streptomyces sp. NBC_01497]|uniref:NEW3 domain-containing protein n=1 Tax=Streptomyces sp. NBC_01497 TaxID=2903885 RepID=UPI002E338A99|nr:NEW3 domain-containing protein [Streptomyces sp. NBC_01497]
MKRSVRGLLAAFTGGLLLVAGLTATSAPAADAADNGAGARPALGWSSWSAVRKNPTAQNIEAAARAMKSSGLSKEGYVYVNVDDFWYHCPGSQGPDVDQYGRWVTDETKFPPKGGEDGVQVVADYVHSLGLKFGLYVTPGISHQAVARNTAIKGTTYHADDIATSAAESNYNCGGMVGIDYTKPGAQAFVDSWAGQFAGWGVDYLKIDGVGTPDVQDVRAWSSALKRTGRPIHLELSNSLDINNAATWADLADGWRTGGDVECYCGKDDSSFPLTSWGSVSTRFDQAAAWAPYGGPGGFNDYDSLEVGNGANDGLTLDERKTQTSLWSLASSPLMLGTDLTHLDPTDLALLKNADVLSVDQDGIDAKRLAHDATSQVFAKREKNGDALVGLFNTGLQTRSVSTTAAALGLPAASDYSLRDLWTRGSSESTGTIAADVPSHGVALFRVHPLDHTAPATRPDTAVAVSWSAPSAPTADGTPYTVTTTFSDNGSSPVRNVDLKLTPSAGVTAVPTSATTVREVRAGATATGTYLVTIPASTDLFTSGSVDATATYRYLPAVRAQDSAGATVTVDRPVGAPYTTFSSTSADFSRLGTRLGIRAQGADLYNGINEYGALYLPGAEHDGSTTTVKIDSQSDTDVWAKTGLMARNDITDADGSPGFAILVETPGHGYLLDSDSDGDGHLDTESAAGTTTYPSWLKLVRNGTTFSGYYSTDGTTWNAVGTADVPTAAATQDVGIFATSHNPGTTGEVDFDDLTTE